MSHFETMQSWKKKTMGGGIVFFVLCLLTKVYIPLEIKTYHLKIAGWKMIHLGVSKNNGTPKSSTFIEFSIINDPFWGTPIFGNTHFLLKMLPFQDNGGPSELPVSSSSGKYPHLPA